MTTRDRIAGAILGSFVADTLSLGVHWVYNPRHIARTIGRLEGPIDPIQGADRYHPNRKRGQFTHFGDQAMVLLRSVSEIGGWSLEDFGERWMAMWDGYDGYVDKATRDTLEAGRSSSDELAGLARMAPLLVALGEEPEIEFVTAVRQQTGLTHGDPALLEASDFFAGMLHAVVHGASIDEALDRALDHDYVELPAQEFVDQARARLDDDADVSAIVKDLGATCHLPDAFPSTIYLLLKLGGSLEEMLIENAMAGGDSGARGMVLGAILGARDGVLAIPASWLEAMEVTAEVRERIGLPSGPPAGRSKFEFENADGHTLDGAIEGPEGEVKGYAVFAHCFTCGKDIAAAARIARALAGHGIAVLRFDFTGLGNSDGDFANTDFSSNVGDLVAAADALRRRHGAPALLIGHSLGGAAVLAAAGKIDEVRGVVTIAAPSEPSHVAKLLKDSRETIEEKGAAEVDLAGRTFTIRKQFLEDIEEHTLADCIMNLRRALMIMHSPTDTVVGIDNARRIFETARHPKSFISLDQADHLLGKRQDSEFVAAVIAAWGERLLG